MRKNDISASNRPANVFVWTSLTTYRRRDAIWDVRSENPFWSIRLGWRRNFWRATRHDRWWSNFEHTLVRIHEKYIFVKKKSFFCVQKYIHWHVRSTHQKYFRVTYSKDRDIRRQSYGNWCFQFTMLKLKSDFQKLKFFLLVHYTLRLVQLATTSLTTRRSL